MCASVDSFFHHSIKVRERITAMEEKRISSLHGIGQLCCTGYMLVAEAAIASTMLLCRGHSIRSVTRAFSLLQSGDV